MIVTRRSVMKVGGGCLAALVTGPRLVLADDVVEIVMQGKADGSHVWYDPIGIHVRPGQTIRWTNRDPGNSHTVTAYHPEIFDRPRRIPEKAKPWDSDYLLPNESFSLTLTVEGVYDYYCVPHELAGMVGRIVVGTPQAGDTIGEVGEDMTPLPEIALNSFPTVEDIIAKGIVHHA